MVKKIFMALCLICLLFSSSAHAASYSHTENVPNIASIRSITYFDNGDYLIESVPAVTSVQRGYVTGHIDYIYRSSNGVIQWTATLTGSFTYNGSSATCTASSCVTSVQSGNWSETYNHAYTSGNTAQADITMVRKVLFITVQTETAHLTLTCDANGNLS